MKKEELVDLWSYLSREVSDSVKGQILIASGRNGKYNNRDYVSANCYLGEVRKACPSFDFRHASKADMDAVLGGAARFRMQYYTPCLAARYDELKDGDKAELFEDRKWVATQKMNGVRAWLFCLGKGIKLYSRNYSDVDCTLLEYSGNVRQLCDGVGFDKNVVVDVEILFDPCVDISADLDDIGLSTDSPLDALTALLHSEPEKALAIQDRYYEKYGRNLISFYLIHPLYWNGVNYVERVLGDGMDVYDAVRDYLEVIGVKAIPRCVGNRVEKENFLNRILATGGEGVVFHNRVGSYCTSENRSKQSYVKLKRTVSASVNGVGMGDTIDGFVTGFKLGSVGTVNEGKVAVLEFSIWLNDAGEMVKKFIGAVGGLEMGVKDALTVEGCSGLYAKSYVGSDGLEHWVSMNPEWDGKVAELSGQALSSVNQRLEHARLLRWCDERSSDSCIYTKEWLMSQTTNVGITYGSI